MQKLSYEYDTLGNLRYATDSLSHTSERKYDERSRVIEEKDANGDSTLYAYTNANELQKITDAELNETTWIYDGAGRVKSETNELNDVRTYKYDGYGRLAEKTDRNGRITKYEYDRLHQISAERWYVGVNLERTISYDFDKVGNLELVSDPSATYDYTYDNLNRRIGVTQTLDGLTPSIVYDRAYDSEDRTTGLSAEIGTTADFVNDYIYDELGRLTTLTQAAGAGHSVSAKRVDFTYDKASQFHSITRYAGTTTANPVVSSLYAYDDHGRIDSITHDGLASGSTFGETHGYTYDNADRLTGYTNLIDQMVATYTYDSRDQIVSAQHDDGVTEYNDLVSDQIYEYDANGNREATFEDDYINGPNNQLLSNLTYIEYTYDDEGNRATRTYSSARPNDDYVTEYTWDHRNRLVKVTQKNEQGQVARTIDYQYDALDQLVGRTEDPDGALGSAAVEQTVFVYDEGQVVLEFQKSGTGDAGAGDLAHRYLWGAAVDQLLADEQVDWSDSDADGEVLWALADHLRSVRDVVDSNGDLRIHRAFDAFGNFGGTHYDASGTEVTAGQAGFVDVALAFTGRWLDRDTRMQNHLHRWYDGEAGRWISEDPIGFAGGDANLYRYVGNEPTGWGDPWGLAPGNWWGNYRSVAPPAAPAPPAPPGFLDTYFHYLLNPSQMDDDLETAFYVAVGTTAVAGTAAGGLSAAAAAGISEVGAVPLSQVPRQVAIEAWAWGLGSGAAGAGANANRPVPAVTQPGIPAVNPALPRGSGPLPGNWGPWYPGQLPGVGPGPYPRPGIN